MGHLMQADYCNEPYDEVSAKQTIEKLRMHWYKIKEKEHVAFKANCGLQNEDYHHNGICDHIACCLLHICVVQQLEEARNNYKQNEQQFQIRAIQKGIKTLQNLEFPLEENQIEKLRIAPYNLGYKTIDKIKEIVSTGYLIRNQQISNDPQQLSVKELTKIWGVGEATAIKWFQQGYRNVDDVKFRQDLSVKQKIGVKYFHDMQQRISRDEVSASSEAIYKVIEDVVDVPAQELFLKTLGSYVRGSSTSGDIDILLVLPNVRDIEPCSVILTTVLRCLQSLSMITDDMSVEVGESLHGNASWFGVGKPVGNPYMRRIDIKVYPYHMQPFAINYFTGDEYFNRALRYYCNTPIKEVQELANRQHPNANCFKLTDHGMYPARYNYCKTGTERHIPVCESLNFQSETAIFEMVGLSYVPPHMRNMK
eukprot:TRINITY_DN6949_c1_g3_i3.p1 TRINITY_DN6949_c1_g3~~TRINITY_DN6949_c1_g3_i3.p1  ORF type:complete len:423 (-),score=16.52 TRINITY_DN6949_c1_g3_i3:77-1345(-)